MKVEQLSCALGAEIKGVSLAETVTNDDLFGNINDLLLKHKVLFLRDQDITDKEHAGFACRFGDLEDHPLTSSVEGEPGIMWRTT
jgi:taurine dioxygenase